MGDPRRSFLFLIFVEEPDVKSQRTSLAIQHASTQFRLKKHHQFGVVYGNESSFTNKVDLSMTDGIDSEHKQEPR